MTNLFTNIGNAFKKGWNNGNIQKGLKLTGATAFTVGATGAMVHSLNNNKSIFGGCCHGGGFNSFNSFGGFGGFGGYGCFSSYSMMDSMSYLNSMYPMPSAPNIGLPAQGQQDPLAACKTLYGNSYNFALVGDKYMAVNKTDSAKSFEASTPEALIQLIQRDGVSAS